MADELHDAYLESHADTIPQFDESTGLIFKQDKQGNVGPGMLPQALMDVYSSVRDTMDFKGLPSDNPNIGSNVLTMGGTLAAAGAPMAEKGAVGALGGKLPPALGEKQMDWIRTLAKENNPPEEIARIITSYYTPPGVEVTAEHITKVLSKEGLLSQSTKGWTNKMQETLDDLARNNDNRFEIRRLFNEAHPNTPLSENAANRRIERSRAKFKDEETDARITAMVEKLKEAHSKLQSADQPK